MKAFMFFLMMFVCGSSFGWSAFDPYTGAYVDVDDSQIIAPEYDIEFFDHDDNQFHYGQVVETNERGILIFDHDVNDFRQLDVEYYE